MNKIMKNRTGLLAAASVLCLLCAGAAGTYARYTTKAAAGDTARIAKWGVELSAVGTLYGEQYGAAGTAESWDDENMGTVHVAATGSNVIAPGTSNTGGLTLTLAGTPEVKARIDAVLKTENIYLAAGDYAIAQPVPSTTVTQASYDAMKDNLYYISSDAYVKAPAEYDGDITKYYTLDNQVSLAKAYYPVVYTSSGQSSGDISSDSLKAVASHIADQLGTASETAENGVTTYKVSKECDPGTDLSGVLGLSQEAVSWKWDYIQGEENSAGEIMYSGADTILASIKNTQDGCAVLKKDGESYIAPVENTDYHLTTGLDLTMTVTQLN